MIDRFVGNRRDLLRAAGRWAILAGLTGGVATLAVGRQGRCDVAPACRMCGRWSRCQLPDAQAERATRKQEPR